MVPVVVHGPVFWTPTELLMWGSPDRSPSIFWSYTVKDFHSVKPGMCYLSLTVPFLSTVKVTFWKITYFPFKLLGTCWDGCIVNECRETARLSSSTRLAGFFVNQRNRMKCV